MKHIVWFKTIVSVLSLAVFCFLATGSTGGSSSSSSSGGSSSSGSSSSSGGSGSAVVVNSRLVPFTTAQGQQAQMVLVDWRNTGSTPIRVVHADIVPYDSSGNKLDSGAPDYTIYAVSSSSSGIAPGSTYSEPDGEGFVVVSSSPAARVEVQITRVAESASF